MQNIEMELENNIKELERLAKKKQLEIEEEKEDFDRKAQFLLVQLSQQQEAIRLLVLEEVSYADFESTGRVQKEPTTRIKTIFYGRNQSIFGREKQFTSKTDEENKQQEAERERNEEREKEMHI